MFLYLGSPPRLSSLKWSVNRGATRNGSEAPFADHRRLLLIIGVYYRPSEVGSVLPSSDAFGGRAEVQFGFRFRSRSRSRLTGLGYSRLFFGLLHRVRGVSRVRTRTHVGGLGL